MNVRADWTVEGPLHSHVHPTYPRDGRETIDDEYEQAQPTHTVGHYLDAMARVHAGDPALPKDYGAYLAQRIASARHLHDMPRETPISRRGTL